MKLYKYIKEAKKMEKTLIAFDVDGSTLRGVQNEISKYLTNADIKHQVLTGNPHISVAQIISPIEKDKLNRIIQDIKIQVRFKPKELVKLYGSITGKDFIAIEYKSNQKYKDIFSDIYSEIPNSIRTFPGGMRPHVSLITLEKDVLSKGLLSEIEERVKLPKIIVKSISLFNKKHKVQFSRRIK
jgi:hypothetical protein